MSVVTAGPVDVEHDAECVLRDGTVLRADIYRPCSAVDLPVLLMRLPYGKSDWPFPPGDPQRSVPAPPDIAAEGYIVVVQDVRGRHRSDGEFAPVDQEENDAYDVVEWAARLPGADGRVGMFGPSYLAHVQWASALAHPPSLGALVSQMSPAHGNRDGLIARGGVNELSRLGWAFSAIAADTLERRADLSTSERARRLDSLGERFSDGTIYGDRPFSALRTGGVPFVGQAIQPWGAPREQLTGVPGMTERRYAELDLPVFVIAGWYDVFLGSSLKQYQSLESLHRQGRLRDRPHLVIGPWTHLDSGSRIGDVDFGPSAAAADMGDDLPLDQQHTRWFDATLKGEQHSLDGVPPVRMFVMGERTWRSYSAYPPPSSPRQWFLADGGRLSASAPEAPGRATYHYNPRDPAPTVGGAILLPGLTAGPLDQRDVQCRPDVISFRSDPLLEPLTVIGAVSVTLHAASTAVDTDFVARLSDDAPAGTSITLADGIIRASERRSHDSSGARMPLPPEPITPGRVIEYSIDLWATAVTFLPGHRIRVDVTSSSFPRWDPNLNTGLSSWDSSDTAVARQTVVWGGRHPSRIVLPVVSGHPGTEKGR